MIHSLFVSRLPSQLEAQSPAERLLLVTNQHQMKTRTFYQDRGFIEGGRRKGEREEGRVGAEREAHFLHAGGAP